MGTSYTPIHDYLEIESILYHERIRAYSMAFSGLGLSPAENILNCTKIIASSAIVPRLPTSHGKFVST
jgi:hypothetical protein